MKITEGLIDYLQSSDEELLVIGASLLEGGSITDEERLYWVRHYMERMKDINFNFTGKHTESLIIILRINEKLMDNGTDR